MTQQGRNRIEFYVWAIGIMLAVISSTFYTGLRLGRIESGVTTTLKQHDELLKDHSIILRAAATDANSKAEKVDLNRVEAKIDNHLNEVAKW